MHKLMEYLCGELEELERKADKEGKLSMAEIQYGETLSSMKKNLLKADEMWEDSEYSMADGGSYEMGRGPYNRNGSYARGGRGRSYVRGGGRGGNRGGANQYGSYNMGGYSRGSDEMVDELRELMNDAPDDQTRMEFQRLIKKLEQM